MTEEMEEPGRSGHVLLMVPVVTAVLIAVFLGATAGLADFSETTWMTAMLLPVGGVLAAATVGLAARQLLSSTPLSSKSQSAVTLGFAAVVLTAGTYFDQTFVAAFAASVMLVIHFLERSNRYEEASLTIYAVLGFVLAFFYTDHVSLAAGSGYNQSYSGIDAERAVAATHLFAFWFLAISVGCLATILCRGGLVPAGNGPWFSELPESFRSKKNLDLPVALGVWAFAHVLTLVMLRSLPDSDAFEAGMYLGNFWAIATLVVVMLVAYLRSERAPVLAAVIAVNWIIHSLATLQDIGLFDAWFSDQIMVWLNDERGLFTWFFLTFWANVAALIISSKGRFGEVAPLREPGPAKRWWKTHWYGITIASAVVSALVVRTIWNVLPAMNAAGTGLWDMTGGSDPWYMKRAVDYVVAQHSHFMIDPDRSYPVGSINPRPPLFTWSLALGGLLLASVFGIATSDAVWWSVAALPALYGALTVLPLAAIGRRVHSKGAGAVVAWLIALMPGHVGHSTFGLADHDAFVLLFFSMAFMFWVRAIELVGHDRILPEASANPIYMLRGLQATWDRRPEAMANALLAGISFATVGLGWKGFVYGPGILFLAYLMQVTLNMFRRRDNMALTSAALTMMIAAFLIPLPFYAHSELQLLFDASGFQPMFYILGFTIAVGWVTVSFRDKPWLLVLISGGILAGTIIATLAILQFVLQIYNGWDVLFTGGYYFSKNKIFGTIAEAQAPSRATLFASYGPVVAIAAVAAGVRGLWLGVRKEDRVNIVLSMWVLVATYMAWTAGRFIFNATPAMAVMGGIALVALWDRAGSSEWVRTWRRSGIATPKSRFRATRKASREHPAVPAVLLVLLLVVSQHATYGIDSGIPRGSDAKVDIDQTFHNMPPDLLRYDFRTGLSLLAGADYAPTTYCGGCQYMGTFGPGFNGGDWNAAYQWLEQQDADVPFGQRPGFVSWWDYGFQALAQGQHPTVADNFQSGIPSAGNMLLASGEHDTIALFVLTLSEGDLRHGSGSFTPTFESVLEKHLEDDQIAELLSISTLGGQDVDAVLGRSHTVIATAGDVMLLSGYDLDDRGLPSPTKTWMVYEDGNPSGSPHSLESNGWTLFNSTKRGSDEVSTETSHYLIGDYWYTKDIVDDLGDVSTSLHRQNARLALGRHLLTSALSLDGMVSLYHDLTTEVTYTVPDSSGKPGETLTRNHDIRYFAVDSRLYPVAGAYYADASYHSRNPTGIFYAPTTLAGLDPESYISTMYETKRGDGPIVMKTQTEYENEYLADITRQQSGGTGDIIELIDIRYTHQPEFFETMIAKVYVGYGSTTLGLPGDAAQPGQHFGGARAQGTPESALAGARPLPGAMMNHFTIANWYESGAARDTVGTANTGVKVLKYHSGATLSGEVILGDIGTVPNARLLIERDAFSGEEEPEPITGEVIDRDNRTYWIPIGSVDADQDGKFNFRVPPGRIRVSAFMGEPDLQSDRDKIVSAQQNDRTSWDMDILGESGTPRAVNPITGILGNVSGATWIGEAIVNVSRVDGHSDGAAIVPITLDIEASGASGRLVYQGNDEFDGSPITDLELEITSIWDLIQMHPYTVNLSNGTVEGDGLEFEGTGEVTFTGHGMVISDGTVTVRDFTGNYSRTILDNHSYTGDGVFDGSGVLVGTPFDANGSALTGIQSCTNGSVPEGQSICSRNGTTGEYLLDGEQAGSGRFTANGTATYTDRLVRESFIGSGTFITDPSNGSVESYGTINGTGVFNGSGRFSGEMVEPGTFHLVDAIPGDYHVKVVYPNGKKVLLPMPLEVGNEQTDDVSLFLPAGHISGTLTYTNGSTLAARMMLFDLDRPDDEPSDSCDDAFLAPCWIDSDENGSYSHGPVIMGNYSLVLDADDDGFDELAVNLSIDSDQSRNLTFGENVPITFDIDFDLHKVGAGGSVELVENQTIPFTSKDLSEAPPIDAIFDAETGRYNVELPIGRWVVNHTLDDAHQFWVEFEVSEESGDISTTYTYVESTWVNGTVLYDADPGKPQNELTGIPNIDLNAQWGGITSTVKTGSNGVFSILLPVGIEVNLTVRTLVSQLQNGTSVEVQPGLNITMIAEPGVEIGGDVLMNRDGNLYDTGIIDWRPVDLVAYNETHDVYWRFDVDGNGHFTGRLLPGMWNLSIDDERLGSSDLTIDLHERNESIKLMTNPANISIDVHVFTDHSADGNASNGTNRSIAFRLVPASFGHGLEVNVTANDSAWLSPGMARVSVEAGEYRIEIEEQNASAESPQPWNTRFIAVGSNPVFGLDNETEEISLPLAAEWHLRALLRNETGDAQPNRVIEFEEVGGDSEFHRITDEDGRIEGYVPEGEWLVFVEPHTPSGSDVVMEFRTLLTIGGGTAPINATWEMVESAHLRIHLTDDATGENLNGYELTATSQDGLGTVNLPMSVDGGLISAELFPGSWNISLNRTDGQHRWIIDDHSIGELSSGTISENVNVTAERWVSLGGAIFWDLDDDDDSDGQEGVEGANVTISSDALPTPVNVTTGADGIWQTFAPVRENYSIQVVANGYANASLQMNLSDEPNGSADIEMIPGPVAVHGNVSFIDASMWSNISDGVTVTLYPSAGFERSSVSPVKVLVSGDWEGAWNATVEPGDWVVIAESIDDGYVAVGKLDAAVDSGGSLDLILSTAGTLHVVTSWLDFEGTEHTLADESVSGAPMISNPKVTLKISDGSSWNVTVDSEGRIEMLLPDGDVELDSGFETTERGRTMNYDGGLIVTVAAQQESPEHELRLTRRALHGVKTNVTALSGGTVHDMGEFGDANLVSNGTGGFTPVVFSIVATYDGNEAVDEYSMSHDIPGEDQAHWTVEYLNGTDPSDESAWNESLSFTLGLDDQIERTVQVRVTPPNASTAHAFDNGHTINLRFGAHDGSYTDQKLTVRVPQTYGLDRAGELESLYGIRNGTERKVTTEWTNSGNGDDTYTVEIDSSALPEGWSATGPSVLSIGKDVTQTHTITVRAPEGATDGTHTIGLTLISEDNTTSESVELVVRVARPVLEITSVGLRDGGEPIAGQVNVFVVEVRNTGLVPADPVVMEAFVDDYPVTFVSDFTTIESNQTHVFEMSLNLGEVPVGTHWFDFRLNTTELDVESEPEPHRNKFSVRSPPTEGTNWIIPVLIVVFVGLAMYLASRARRARVTPF